MQKSFAALYATNGLCGVTTKPIAVATLSQQRGSEDATGFYQVVT